MNRVAHIVHFGTLRVVVTGGSSRLNVMTFLVSLSTLSPVKASAVAIRTVES